MINFRITLIVSICFCFAICTSSFANQCSGYNTATSGVGAQSSLWIVGTTTVYQVGGLQSGFPTQFCAAVGPATYMFYTPDGGITYTFYRTTSSASESDTDVCTAPGTGVATYMRFNLSTTTCTTEPDHCSNGVKDGGEAGIDCGGTCGGSCGSRCPPGSEPVGSTEGCENAPGVGIVEGGCFAFVSKTSSGLCPPGSYESSYLCPGTSGGICSYAVDPVLSLDSIPESNLPAVTGPTPTGSLSSGGTSTTTSTTSSTSGSTTTTTTTTTTNTSSTSSATGGTASGTSSKSTTIIYNSETGEKTETEEETGSFTAPTAPASTYDATTTAGTRFSDRASSFFNSVKTAPVFAPLFSVLNPNVGQGSSTYTVSMGSFGTSEINLADFAGVWSVMYYCMIFVGMFVAARLIIANK